VVFGAYSSNLGWTMTRRLLASLAPRAEQWGFWPNFPCSILNVSVTEEYSFAERVKSGASAHLPFAHLDPVHVPFDSTGTVRQDQPILDRA
jgi:hypothetical protein